MTPPPDVSIIIATTLEPSRAESLTDTVESILSQTGCSAVAIIVVNGDRYDPEALRYWRSRDRVRVFQLAEGNYLKARLYGRQHVDSEFFGAIDDDDLLLPGGLKTRLDPMRIDPTLNVVVGNGLIERDGRESVMLAKLDLHRRSPLLGLAAENWMPSACAALFRTEAVGAEFFSHMDQGIEWTALGYRLAVAGHKILFVDDLTYRISDTPRSLSKNLAYIRAVPESLRRLLALPLPREARRVWERKYGAAEHWLAEINRSNGNLRLAWRAHLRSLVRPGGLQYLLYARKLMPWRIDRASVYSPWVETRQP